MIPLAPFDGGRVTAVLSPKLWLAGVPILVALFFYRPSPLLILMALLAAPHVMKAIRGIRAPEEQAYYAVRTEVRVQYGLLYVGLAGLLAIMCHDLHGELQRVTVAP